MIDVRVRTRVGQVELRQKVGKILTDEDYNMLLTGPARVHKPDGRPLCVYLPGYLSRELMDSSYDILHGLKKYQANTRGKAGGTRTVEHGKRWQAAPVSSHTIGALDPARPVLNCRLTAWSGRETEKFRQLFPLFQAVGGAFAQQVPERYAAQMQYVSATDESWTIEGTPFTTITVNNSYPTGVHQDSGDLDEGFSCLAVLRRGQYRGGRLTWPEYRVSVDLQDGDVLLMDAHEWHGNTALHLESDDAERISVVCYYRTNMHACGGPEEEAKKSATHVAV